DRLVDDTVPAELEPSRQVIVTGRVKGDAGDIIRAGQVVQLAECVAQRLPLFPGKLLRFRDESGLVVLEMFLERIERAHLTERHLRPDIEIAPDLIDTTQCSGELANNRRVFVPAER